MAPTFVDVAAVSGSCENLSLMVRVVRLWTIPSFNNASIPGTIEMVLLDKKGDKTHCTIRRHLVSRFLSVLDEGRCYKLCCLAVVPNLGSFRTTTHEYRLIFHFKITVSPVEFPKIDMYGLTPIPFGDVIHGSLNPDYLIDVIGLLTGLSPPKEYEREGKASRMSVMELCYENVRIECALFGEYVDQIQSFVAAGSVDLLVIVLQCVKVKSFRGKIGLQNVMFASKILFNPDIQEVVDFKNSISIEGSSSNPTFNIYREPAHVTVEEDFMKTTPRSSIEKLIANNEGGSFIILGTISSVIEEGPWWYTACRCGRSVMPEGAMYFCDICQRHIFSVSPRFKVKLEVEDPTGTGIFILFESECSCLLRKSCAELFLEQMKDPEAVRACYYPPIFNELCGRQLLFKLETKVVSPNRYHGTFTVKCICEDSAMLAMFSLKGSELTLTKATFTPAFSPMLSLGELGVVSLGGGNTATLVDDINLNGENEALVGVGTVVSKLETVHDKKQVSRIFSNDIVADILNGGDVSGEAMTPAKRSLEEEFNEVASPPSNGKFKAKKAV